MDASASAAVSEAVATESGSSGEATANATEAANTNTSEANEEGLPEWEPLSPEIVEDEAEDMVPKRMSPDPGFLREPCGRALWLVRVPILGQPRRRSAEHEENIRR